MLTTPNISTKIINIWLRKIATRSENHYGKSQLTINELRKLCFKCDVHARANGNSASSQRFRGLTWCWLPKTGARARTSTRGRKAQKIGASRPNPRGVGQKRSLSDRGCVTRCGGVTQNLYTSSTPRYYTYRYKLLLKLSTFKFTFATWVSRSPYYFPPPFYSASSTFSLTILESIRNWTST